MGFNLITFIAQIVNLFLLIWLLQHFLYRPVLSIIDKRRKEVADTIQEAEDKLKSSEEQEAHLKQQQKDFDKLYQKRLDEMERDIHQQKAKMMKELELNYRIKRENLQEDLNRSWETSQVSIQEMLATEFMTLSRKILSEWTQQTPMDQILSLFHKKIHALSKQKKNVLEKLIKQEKLIQIITSEKLTTKQQVYIQNIVSKNLTLPPKMRFQFKKRQDLVLGIEMRVGTFVLEWNLNGYLEEINQRLKQNIENLIVPVQRKARK
ncbi:MAG: hypothetical protein II938_03845 [Alphaproteobacteria bacterium]|nr:hypothetical protein [Alphaproteobacteria bacterium]